MLFKDPFNVHTGKNRKGVKGNPSAIITCKLNEFFTLQLDFDDAPYASTEQY